MASARQRQLVLLVLGAAALLAIVAPGMGEAQDASPGPEPPETAALVTRGEELYNTTCIACHQAGGAGVTDVVIGGYPALAGNVFVTLEDPVPLLQVLITGRAGMPHFRGYADEDIASVATYIRQAFGNEAGPVDPALVAEIRAQYVVTPLPPATPIATEFPGSLAPAAAGTPAVDPASPDATAEVEGGASSGGITPIPTIGQ